MENMDFMVVQQGWHSVLTMQRAHQELDPTRRQLKILRMVKREREMGILCLDGANPETLKKKKIEKSLLNRLKKHLLNIYYAPDFVISCFTFPITLPSFVEWMILFIFRRVHHGQFWSMNLTYLCRHCCQDHWMLPSLLPPNACLSMTPESS